MIGKKLIIIGIVIISSILIFELIIPYYKCKKTLSIKFPGSVYEKSVRKLCLKGT